MHLSRPFRLLSRRLTDRMLLLLICMPIATLCGQSLKILGSVKDKDGKPWVGAVVHLYSKPLIDLAELGKAELLRVTVSKRGRFRASIRATRKYYAWAEYTNASGEKRFSKIVSDIAKLPALHLVESELEIQPVELVVHGVANWKEQGPLQFEWISKTAGGYGMRLQLVGNRTKLPVLPGSTGYVRVKTKDGVLIYEKFVRQSRLSRKSAASSMVKRMEGLPEDFKVLPGLPDPRMIEWGASATENIILSPPLYVRLKLMDAASKKPLAGAKVFYRHRSAGNGPREEAMSMSDKDGFVEFRAPWPTDNYGQHKLNGDLIFIVRSKGYELKRCGWQRYARFDMKPLTEDVIKDGKAPELTVFVKKGFSISGKITLDGKNPAPGVAVVYNQQGWDSNKQGNSRRSFIAKPQIHRSDKAGNFAIHGLYARYNQAKIALVLAPTLLQSILGDRLGNLPLHPRIFLQVPSLNSPRKDIVLPTIDLSKLKLIALTANLPNGDPAAFAEVDVPDQTQMSRYRLSPFFSDMYRCDKRGRLGLLSFDKLATLIIIHKEHYLIADKLDTARSLQLTLKAMASIKGMVVDDLSQGIPDARFSIYSSSWSSGGKYTRWVRDVNRKLLSARSNKDGSFALYFIPDPGLSYGLRVSTRIGRQTYYSAETISIAQESRKEVVIEIPVDYRKEMAEQKRQAKEKKVEK